MGNKFEYFRMEYVLISQCATYVWFLISWYNVQINWTDHPRGSRGTVLNRPSQNSPNVPKFGYSQKYGITSDHQNIIFCEVACTAQCILLVAGTAQYIYNCNIAKFQSFFDDKNFGAATKLNKSKVLSRPGKLFTEKISFWWSLHISYNRIILCYTV